MCGMTRIEDVEHAINLGVDAIGLVFYLKSSRCLSIERASLLLKDIPPFVDVVAVMVNPEREMVQHIIDQLPITLLQFHGDESPEFCQDSGIPYIKAVHPKTSEQIVQFTNQYMQAKSILLDAATETSRGGTGHTFDWNIIPRELSKPYILAGGLNEQNIMDAVKVCRPYAVDVCSGVEISPGIKDHQKMSRFIKALWGKE